MIIPLFDPDLTAAEHAGRSPSSMARALEGVASRIEREPLPMPEAGATATFLRGVALHLTRAASHDVVAIIGSRPENRYPNQTAEKATRDEHRKQLVREYVAKLSKDALIVSGGAAGPDTWAEEVAYELGIHFAPIEAIWNPPNRPSGHDPSAGHRRNAYIAFLAHRCVAFFGSEDTSGTAGCVKLFRDLGKPVEEVRPWT